MASDTPGLRPQTESLDNPLYYLRNMEMVVRWVRDHHRDLLVDSEFSRLNAFLELPLSARALLTRMIMRSGEVFRTDRLRYPELPDSVQVALEILARHNWLDPEPGLDVETLFRLFTLKELRPAFRARLAAEGISGQPGKAAMQAVLEELFPEPAPVHAWLQDAPPRVVKLSDMALFDRARLMFFGNLNQSWSDFVLVELGLQRYEQVPLSAESRAFSRREEVDLYLRMQECRDQLDQGASPRTVWQQLPESTDNPWLQARRDRLLLELGRRAERQGDQDLALDAYTHSNHRIARLKQLRLLERQKRYEEAWQILLPAMQTLRSDSEQIGLLRLHQRIAKKLSLPKDTRIQPVVSESLLTLDNPGLLPVELAVAEHLEDEQAPVYFVENTLFNALFGLLFWQAIFQPLPGAFFHPFHTGPADLTRQDFVARRQAAIREALNTLEDDRYQQIIRDTWRDKQGISNPFVAWPVLTDSLLDLALTCIPASHLTAIFRRLLVDIREHRSGFPDLIRFDPEAELPAQRYQLIEVKGPGDRLQDHQRCWLVFFNGLGVSAEVCHVRWHAPETEP